MKIVVGLGNPGKEYENTRHNIGFATVDRLQSQIFKSQVTNSKQFSNFTFQYQKKFLAEVCGFGEIKLVKPQTYMNRSGVAVRRIVDFYANGRGQMVDGKYGDLWVVHDDLDIRLGEYKIQFGVGPKVHRGVNSVEEQLGTEEFWRVRVGVDNRGESRIMNHEARGQAQTSNLKPQTLNKMPGDKYVLMKLGTEEKEMLDRVVGEVVGELVERLEV